MHEGNVNVSCTAELMVETSEDHLETSTADVHEDLERDGVCPPSPARIQTTPTFSLKYDLTIYCLLYTADVRFHQ